MAIRLLAMKRVLQVTGSIYLHCDPTASHYLKLVMDAIFGPRNFRNEIVWRRTISDQKGSQHRSKTWGNNTDSILYYSKSRNTPLSPEKEFEELSRETILQLFPKTDEYGERYNTTTPIFCAPSMGPRPNLCYEWRGFRNPHPSGWRLSRERLEEEYQRGNVVITPEGRIERRSYAKDYRGSTHGNLWVDINPSLGQESLGYPTQKPLALLERIIKASCPPDGVVLDPFCGCGTTVFAAESHKRRWVGIDISTFATGLIKERIQKAFPLTTSEITVKGAPESIWDARVLAKEDKFEFEKWVCGRIGAEGMYHDPGTPGADGGVDGIIKFYRIFPDRKLRPEYAIVQVKGGHVTPDSVRALRERVDRFDVTAGVLVCFEQYMGTVENQRSREMFRDAWGAYPVIQGYSVEDLLDNTPLQLPLDASRRQGARLNLL